jgi:cytochrome c-type biogenesis protein CcmE
MNPMRRRRLIMVVGILAGAGVAAGLAWFSTRYSVGFTPPTRVAEGAVQAGKRFQLGGMVKAGSVQRITGTEPGTFEYRFIVTDFANDVPVVFRNQLLPDLFKENAGVVTNGRLDESGVFVADEVLAKHDENYMPPAVGEALRRGESRLEPPSAQP